jgi:hypothetical protein
MPINEISPKVIAIGCGDTRVCRHELDFFDHRYKPHGYHPILVPGGGKNLAEYATNPGDADYLCRKLDTLSYVFNPPKICICFHEDCLMYNKGATNPPLEQWIELFTEEFAKVKQCFREIGKPTNMGKLRGYAVSLNGRIFSLHDGRMIYRHEEPVLM